MCLLMFHMATGYEYQYENRIENAFWPRVDGFWGQCWIHLGLFGNGFVSVWDRFSCAFLRFSTNFLTIFVNFRSIFVHLRRFSSVFLNFRQFSWPHTSIKSSDPEFPTTFSSKNNTLCRPLRYIFCYQENEWEKIVGSSGRY